MSSSPIRFYYRKEGVSEKDPPKPYEVRKILHEDKTVARVELMNGDVRTFRHDRISSRSDKE